jgi:hypothetical protein
VNRRLILLNVVLAGVLGFAGYQWRNEIREAQARAEKTRKAAIKSAPVQPFVPLENQPAVLATGYNDVAQKLLLHPSRNPALPVVEPPPPPPPQPMPPLPKYHGSMNLDGGPVAILSEKENAQFEEVRPGGMIGQFKLIDVNTRDITFEWNGQQVRRTLDDLLDRKAADAANAAYMAAAAANAPAAPAAVKAQIGPSGPTNQFGTRGCDPNDSYPTGAVVDGWRKAAIPTPFGVVCRWEQVGR